MPTIRITGSSQEVGVMIGRDGRRGGDCAETIGVAGCVRSLRDAALM